MVRIEQFDTVFGTLAALRDLTSSVDESATDFVDCTEVAGVRYDGKQHDEIFWRTGSSRAARAVQVSG